jgi:hypothetical protein
MAKGRYPLVGRHVVTSFPGETMIVDHRTYNIKPGKLNEYLKRYETEFRCLLWPAA